MLLAGTEPSTVCGLNVQATVRTKDPAWKTVIVALVKATSVIVSVQFVFGHAGAPGTGDCGGRVVTLKGVLPFLSCEFGINCSPVRVTEAGF